MSDPYSTARAIAAKYATPELDSPTAKVRWVKSVPDVEPNADGNWVKVIVEPHHTDPRKYGRTDEEKRLTMWDMLTDLLPDGFHAVAMSDDPRLTGKPGNWLGPETRHNSHKKA